MATFDLEFWQTRLDEIQDELTNMVGRPGFSVGSFTVDEKENYDRLLSLKLEAEGKIEALGGGDEGTRNVRIKGGSGNGGAF